MPPRSANGNYTVQAGDTLQSIASNLWGDASLWYLIADANGLSGSTALAAGSALTIPAKVVNVHNSASTFTVYDPSKAIGNLQPSVQPVAPPSNQHGGCGVLGQILEVVVAAVVVYFTAGAAIHAVAGALGLGSTVTATSIAGLAAQGNLAAVAAEVGGGAIAGAPGSIAAQSFGLATGIQSQFSWSGVALAALSGGVNGGVSSLLKNVPISGGDFGRGFVTGAASNAITQGVAVATGLQSKFDWAGVAVGGVVGGVTAALTDNSLTRFSPGGIANAAVAGVAGAIAGAATRSVLTGSDFGDNLIAALPDVIGSTIGNAIIGQIDPPTPNAGGNDLMANLTKHGAQSFGGSQTDATSLAMGLTTTPQTITAFAGPTDRGTQVFQLAETAGLALPPDIKIDPAETLGQVLSGGLAGQISEAMTGPAWSDGVYRPGEDDASLLLIQGNVRARMGGNGPPPEFGTMRDVFPGLQNAPGGAILAPIDSFLGISGMSDEANLQASQMAARSLYNQIRQIDPSYNGPDSFQSLSEMSWKGRAAYIDSMLMDRAATIYLANGDIAPLQVEALRFLQQRVDSAYADAVGLYNTGRLTVRLGPEEAIGNYIDGRVRAQLRGLYNHYGIDFGPGENITINNRNYETSETGRSYTIPDARVGNLSMDWTLTAKTLNTSQVQGFFGSDSRPVGVIIVRPTQIGGSYYITRPAGAPPGR